MTTPKYIILLMIIMLAACSGGNSSSGSGGGTDSHPVNSDGDPLYGHNFRQYDDYTVDGNGVEKAWTLKEYRSNHTKEKKRLAGASDAEFHAKYGYRHIRWPNSPTGGKCNKNIPWCKTRH